MNKSEKQISSTIKTHLHVCLWIILFVSGWLLSGCALHAESIVVENLPFAMPKITVPQFPSKTFLITDFGAVGDGQTKNTQAIAKTIDACAKAGGGSVVIPAGFWMTGPIVLKSNINLHLEQGAIIVFSTDLEDYPMQQKISEGLKSIRHQSPISGENLKNIAITGDGVIDGSGGAWRHVKKYKLRERDWKDLVSSGGVLNEKESEWFPSKEALNGAEIVAQLRKKKAPVAEYAAAREYLRPVMVSLISCKNVLLDGPTFQNSPAWNIHPLMCENMTIRNITVRNPWFSQNGDGLDLESCRNVLVYNCSFDVGDDAMCMKSGKDEYGRKRGIPTENIVIWDCTVYHGHGGFTIGSEMSGGVRNIFVRNCNFLGTDIGLRFKSTRGRGGVVENIYIQDIRMKDIPTYAIRFNTFYAGKLPNYEQSLSLKADPVSEETPIFRNIHMKNIICNGARDAVYMQGLPEMPIQNITMEDMIISADSGVTCIETEQIHFKNVTILPKNGAVMNLYNSRNVTMENVKFDTSKDVLIMLAGEKTRDIKMKGQKRSSIADKIKFGKDAKPTAIRWD